MSITLEDIREAWRFATIELWRTDIRKYREAVLRAKLLEERFFGKIAGRKGFFPKLPKVTHGSVTNRIVELAKVFGPCVKASQSVWEVAEKMGMSPQEVRRYVLYFRKHKETFGTHLEGMEAELSFREDNDGYSWYIRHKKITS